MIISAYLFRYRLCPPIPVQHHFNIFVEIYHYDLMQQNITKQWKYHNSKVYIILESLRTADFTIESNVPINLKDSILFYKFLFMPSKVAIFIFYCFRTYEIM